MKYSDTHINREGIWKIKFRNCNLYPFCIRKHFIINHGNLSVKIVYQINEEISEAIFLIKDKFSFFSPNSIKQILIEDEDITNFWKFTLCLNNKYLNEKVVF